jgi:hypothetical protein
VRDSHFALELINKTEEFGEFGDRALIAAAKLAYRAPMGTLSDKTALKKAKSKLTQPDIQSAIRDVYEAADFSIVDAVKKHVEHIQRGNYQALKDFFAMAVPKPAQKVDIRSLSVTQHLNKPTSAPASISARVIGPAALEGGTDD